jgi:hypothetical protein
MNMGILLLSSLLSASPAAADVWPINQRNLNIPIRVDPARRQEIKELILFCSSDQGKTWSQIAIASPDQSGFPFYAPADGVYWFSVCVVDQKGNREPPDIYKVPPSQKILVDTLKPVLRIVTAEYQADEIFVSWEIQEEHLDVATLKLEYRTPDMSPNMWLPVSVSQASIGQTKFRPTSVGAVTVRMQVQDQAGNAAMVEKTVVGVASAAYNPPPANAYTGSSYNPTAPGAGAATSPTYVDPRNSMSAPASNYQQVNSTAMNSASRFVASSGLAATNVGQSPASDVPRSNGGQPGDLKIVNSRQVTIDYQVTNKGPSGLGRVELWMTKDDGRSWQFFFEDKEQSGHLTVDLPGEGVYGFSLVLKNRALIGRRPPIAGDPPEIRVEVDTTPPQAGLLPPQADPTQPNTLNLLWEARDRNLAANPITLAYAESRNGPWHDIATELPNTGRYAWRMPETMPAFVYLRLTVRDKADNVADAITGQQVLVDLKEPEGHLLGVNVNVTSGASKHP